MEKAITSSWAEQNEKTKKQVAETNQKQANTQAGAKFVVANAEWDAPVGTVQGMVKDVKEAVK